MFNNLIFFLNDIFWQILMQTLSKYDKKVIMILKKNF
jgi:hypothetical protein